MSRRRVRLPDDGDGYPPPLDVFDPADWWVEDPGAWEQMAVARIYWSAAREAYRTGGDWQAHLEPPLWWTFKYPNN